MSAEPDSIWNEIRAELREQTPDFKFHIWLEPLELAGLEGTTLFVRAPEHIRSWVAERYLGLLRQAATRRYDPAARVEIVGADWQPRRGGPGARAGPRVQRPPNRRSPPRASTRSTRSSSS